MGSFKSQVNFQMCLTSLILKVPEQPIIPAHTKCTLASMVTIQICIGILLCQGLEKKKTTSCFNTFCVCRIFFLLFASWDLV